MADPKTCVTPYFLHPAEMVIADRPLAVHTILGSCVAVTMRASRLGVAAVSHSLLPIAGVPAGGLEDREALKYVDTAIDVMLRALMRHGALVQELEVKVFGGADHLEGASAAGSYHVGGRNVEAALRTLSAFGIVPAARGVGGSQGRVLDFNTFTGEVLVRRLPHGFLSGQK